LLVLIKNGEKVTHIFFPSKFNTQQHHKKIKKLSKTHEKLTGIFNNFFEHARVQIARNQWNMQDTGVCIAKTCAGKGSGMDLGLKSMERTG
jgi:hypothetical protein